MTKRVSRLLATAALMLCATPQLAGAQSFGGWSYEWSMPMGDLKDYVDNDSWLGFMLEGRWFVRGSIALGAQVGYYEFYQNTQGTITLPQGAVSGDQYRHMFALPVQVGLFWASPSGTGPFLGISAGAYYFDQEFDVGAFSLTDNDWVFGVAPEVGVILGHSGPGAVALKARYHYPLSAGNFLLGEPRSFQFLSVGLSMYYRHGY